jgi:aldose 1-epimerase
MAARVQRAGGAEGPPLPKQPRRHWPPFRGKMDLMSVPTLPLTGAQYEITAGDFQATVTELGAGLRALSLRGKPLIRTYGADELPPAGAGQLLAPWPNRIDHGRYSFGGVSYQLDLSEPARDSAIHGLTRWASWRITAQAPDHVELGLDLLGRTGYPFCLELRAAFRLSSDDGLEVTLTARNSGSRAAPFGTGAHPYFIVSDGLVDDCELQIPAGSWQPTDDRGIPAGQPADVTGSEYDFRTGRKIGGTALDHAFTALARDADGRARARLSGPAAEIALWLGPGYRWLQLFTGDPLGADARRRALAIEPMTCPPNAFVTGFDLATVEPGDSLAYRWGVHATTS